MSFTKSAGGVSPEDAERAWFAGLLWKAFPEATSENALCKAVAEFLTTERRPITPRTVKNWLRQENTPHFRYVMMIIGLSGVESVLHLFDPGACR